ncbi:MAG: hypothetical protein ACLP5H_22035 [Desulfomonilaceae bacterium]
MIAKFTRKDFLEAIFAQYYKEYRGFILVKSFKRGDPKQSTRYFPNIEILAKEHYGEERDVYFGICPRERMKAEKEHIHFLVALWADLDIGSEGHEEKKVYYQGPQHAAKAIRSFPRAPSIIVESGRGAHLYWLLKAVNEVQDPKRIERALKNISDHLQCDTDVSLDTVLRLPETSNTKIPGKPVICDVKFINPNFRYTLEDFETLGQRIVVPQPSMPASGSIPPAGMSAPIAMSEEESEENGYQSSGAPGQTIDDSLVLDETIIDELIDDISMTASVVLEAPMPSTQSGGYGAKTQEPPGAATQAARPAKMSSLIPSASATGSVLARLSSSRAEVEISLVGSNQQINGILIWNENGLIGIESGEDLYTIPLSSVSFIRSKA